MARKALSKHHEGPGGEDSVGKRAGLEASFVITGGAVSAGVHADRKGVLLHVSTGSPVRQGCSLNFPHESKFLCCLALLSPERVTLTLQVTSFFNLKP